MSAAQDPGNIPDISAAATSVAQSLNNATSSTTRSLLSSSPRELLALPFRGLYQAEAFAFSTLPRRLVRLVGIQDMASFLWGPATGTGAGADAAVAATQTAAEVAREGVADAVAQAETGNHISEIFQAIIKFSGFFSYVTSRWSLACFTVALILNRITIYASTRRPLSLDWNRRLALRIVPILLFLSQIHSLLRAIRCQTSPDYPLLRYGTPGKRLSFDHAGGGGFLYTLSSTLLPWETDQQSCSAVQMIRPASGSTIAYGSFSLLWPVFIRLCLNHFVETLSCALQGRTVVTEAGMSIFEHSLAFAEAESTISQTIGLGLFGLPKPASSSKDDMGEGTQSAVHLLSRAQVLERMNITPELLLIALISCCNSLTSNLLDVFGKQSRYRFANTAFWGLCFMSAMAWGLLGGGSSGGADSLVLKFPTVCIVGFVPHLLILLGIVICVSIYVLALVVTAFSLPMEVPRRLSLREKFSIAHENMQGATQIHNIRFNRHEDFYTTLLRIGYTALSAASEAVFLNEGRGVVARNMTWLEEDRLAEIESSRQRQNRTLSSQNRDLPFEGGEPMNFDIPQAPSEWESGYSREKKIEKPKTGSRSVRSQADLGGVGALRGALRCYHGFSFFRGIFYLLLRWVAYGLDKLLNKCGISVRPQWLKTIVGSRKRGAQERRIDSNAESLDFWILTEEGELELPGNHEFDVEREMRKRERSNMVEWQQSDERRLDEKLYDWWKAGGSWGDQDYTADYAPSVHDVDDITSVVSMSTNADFEWEDESDGRRTPTPADPFPSGFSRESTPVHEPMMDISSFARLLDPRDKESRQEARILAAHLAAGQDGRILTRRQYQQQVERERSQVLLSSRLSHLAAKNSNDEKRKPNIDEESEMLEKLILSRRSQSSSSSSAEGQTWESGASGLGPSGPPCVICQTSPRSIITWPCRCLCVCEECRVSLAMNNFGNCVTCRQEVGGFVRLWVP